MSIFDLAGQERELERLQRQSQEPGLWDDPERAQRLLQQVAEVKERLQPWLQLVGQAKELEDLLLLAEQQDDASVGVEAQQEVERLQARLAQLRVQTLLAGEYDRHNALLTVNSGAGGTDAQDWAQMLVRMYSRWGTERGMSVRMLDSTSGEEAGLSSATVEIRGDYAYGYLKGETGVHRLVRISPFDANRRRHTSFASVEVMPEIEEAAEVRLQPEDLRTEFFRSSGAGGQHVNKTDTAVRITHLSTGVVVQCQNERSQHQNREMALRVLRSRLFELERRKREEQLSQLRGEQAEIAWGNQIRSYVLHPYSLVKDHRTSVEVSAAQKVLDGDLDPFIQAYLEQQPGGPTWPHKD